MEKDREVKNPANLWSAAHLSADGKMMEQGSGTEQDFVPFQLPVLEKSEEIRPSRRRFGTTKHFFLNSTNK
jgi:hypothetical protein